MTVRPNPVAHLLLLKSSMTESLLRLSPADSFGLELDFCGEEGALESANSADSEEQYFEERLGAAAAYRCWPGR